MQTANKQRFLLLDERNVATTQNVQLKIGSVTKHDANPLMVEDKPWEKRFDNFYGNILYDTSDELFKCWYSPFIIQQSAKGMSLEEREKIPYTGHEPPEMGVCYATSIDGIVWEKHHLGLVEFENSAENNLICRGPHGMGVFKDLRATKKTQRYKSIFQGLRTSTSQDGLKWSKPRHISRNKIAGDTHNNVIWAPTLKKYVGFTRTWGETDRLLKGPKTKTNHIWGRQVSRIESSDFCDWSKAEVVIDCTVWEHQPYAMPVFFHANIYIGLMAVHDQSTDRVWTELTWSNDTKIWHRVNEGTALIEGSPRPLDYDYGCIFACATPLFLKDEIRIYYGGSDGLHSSWRNGCLALATLRPDGFAGYQPMNPHEVGIITTPPLDYHGQAINVSADVSHNGWLKAHLINSGNVRIATQIINQSVTDALLFQSSVTVADKIQIEFELKGSTLYAFLFLEKLGATV